MSFVPSMSKVNGRVALDPFEVFWKPEVNQEKVCIEFLPSSSDFSDCRSMESMLNLLQNHKNNIDMQIIKMLNSKHIYNTLFTLA